MPTIIAFVAIIFLLGIGFSRRRGGVVYEEFEDEEFVDDGQDGEGSISGHLGSDGLEMEKKTIDIPAPVIDDDLELLDDEFDDDEGHNES
jgi:hypothetical protein